MGDTGRHWSRCKLKIGSSDHFKQICCLCLGADQSQNLARRMSGSSPEAARLSKVKKKE